LLVGAASAAALGLLDRGDIVSARHREPGAGVELRDEPEQLRGREAAGRPRMRAERLLSAGLGWFDAELAQDRVLDQAGSRPSSPSARHAAAMLEAKIRPVRSPAVSSVRRSEPSASSSTIDATRDRKAGRAEAGS